MLFQKLKEPQQLWFLNPSIEHSLITVNFWWKPLTGVWLIVFGFTDKHGTLIKVSERSPLRNPYDESFECKLGVGSTELFDENTLSNINVSGVPSKCLSFFPDHASCGIIFYEDYVIKILKSNFLEENLPNLQANPFSYPWHWKKFFHLPRESKWPGFCTQCLSPSSLWLLKNSKRYMQG